MIFGWVRNIGLVTSVAVMMLGAATTSRAQWVRCGPQGGVVTSFAVMGSRIFAATSGNNYNNTPGSGVFVSMDSGVTWEQSNTGLTDTSVSALAVSGNYLIASTASGSLFRSSDDGASWHALPAPNTSQPISSFTTLGTYLFAITGNDGVLRSTDNGMSWNRFAIDTGVLDIHTLAVMDTILFANGSWGDGGGVYRSTDYGANWTEVYNAVFDITVLGNKLFAAMYHTVSLGVNVSTDQGVTWTGTEGGGCGVYDQMATAGSVVFSFHTQNGIFYSTDSGADWTSTNAFADFYAVAALGTTLFVGNETGILRSTNNGISWVTSNAGIYMFEPSILTQPYNFAAVGHTIIASNYQNGIRSSDGGTHWTIDTFATHNQAKYVVMGNVLLTTGLGGLYRSADLAELPGRLSIPTSFSIRSSLWVRRSLQTSTFPT